MSNNILVSKSSKSNEKIPSSKSTSSSEAAVKNKKKRKKTRKNKSVTVSKQTISIEAEAQINYKLRWKDFITPSINETPNEEKERIELYKRNRRMRYQIERIREIKKLNANENLQNG